ncbi:DIS3-like exonuclease 1 [Tetrabaena socialis]|uniref:DIS3-like exonuclease 1 n=1 Tax=Tetrabaena socialis TaxID=47790 RepID=A0A2J8ABQ4_9CHLO|nr:DIS3-like exonuclease 1 [Tetrabaena socialis]|eukprot:PNH09951.1 DIS3-like exonuclease 1 [Tetrabaena socialis]
MVKAQQKPDKGARQRIPKDRDDDAGPSTSGGDGARGSGGDGPAAGGGGRSGSIGQRTSGIRNKQKRSEMYHKLKVQQEVGCTDVDDAMHVRFLDPNDQLPTTTTTSSHLANRQPPPPVRVEVGVHIADVSWFVRAGGMLDGEARDRATSVYLVDRRLDMLPGLLSERLCSLREGVERLAVSVIWTLARRERPRREAAVVAEDGGYDGSYEYEVEDVWYGRTIIRSRHQLHYQQGLSASMHGNAHHRYVFEEKEARDPEAKGKDAGKKKKAVVARLQELGPRFTLKLLSLQKGTFDSKNGEFEWLPKKENKTSRRRFFL